MRARPAPGRSEGRQTPEGREAPEAGFTLIEVLVALAILSIAVVASIQGFAQGLRLLKLAGDHQHAMLLADQKMREVVDPAGHRATIVAAPDEVRQTRALSADLRIDATPPEALRVNFEPNGVSSGGDFRLTTGRMRFRVSVDQLTGRVRIERQE